MKPNWAKLVVLTHLGTMRPEVKLIKTVLNFLHFYSITKNTSLLIFHSVLMLLGGAQWDLE